MSAHKVTLLLSSAGRRPYIVEWFQEALQKNKADGRIVVVDADPYAPSRSFADDFIVAPPIVDASYQPWLAGVLADEKIDLAVSLNDFELSQWSRLDPLFPGIDRLLRLNADMQQVVEDKFQTATHLVAHGVSVPPTQTAEQAIAHVADSGEREFIIKGRFGSASRGLRSATLSELSGGIHEAVREVTDPTGRPADLADPSSLKLVVVQPRIRGQEYGLDVVCDLNGRYMTTLARRKIVMRAGETDRAESVDAAPFEALARRIAEAIPHRGSIDVDVLIDQMGKPWVIDINPRFGGGYPFSHLAGADIPAAYIAWILGIDPDPAWLKSDSGVISSKFVGVARS